MATRPILYYALFSPPSRACLLTSKIIGLNVELKSLDFSKKDHHSDWFLKINPRHTVPVLVDEGVPLCDSHAIATYMVSKYGQSHHESLYPRDLLSRATVDERLYFESSVLFQVVKDFASKIIHGDHITYSRKSILRCHSAYNYLEKFLARSAFVAGERLSVADISINTTLITLDKMVPVDEERCPKTIAWMRQMRNEIPDYDELNDLGAKLLLKRFEDALVENMTKHD